MRIIKTEIIQPTLEENKEDDFYIRLVQRFDNDGNIDEYDMHYNTKNYSTYLTFLISMTNSKYKDDFYRIDITADGRIVIN